MEIALSPPMEMSNEIRKIDAQIQKDYQTEGSCLWYGVTQFDEIVFLYPGFTAVWRDAGETNYRCGSMISVDEHPPMEVEVLKNEFGEFYIIGHASLL